MKKKTVDKALREIKTYERNAYMVKDKLEEIMLLLGNIAFRYPDNFLREIDRWTIWLDSFERAFLPLEEQKDYIDLTNYDIGILTESAREIIESELEKFEARISKSYNPTI